MPHGTMTGAQRSIALPRRGRISIPSLLVAMMLVIGGLAMTTPVAAVTASRSNLAAGATLQRPAELFSATGTYWLVLTGTGNLVLYGPNHARLWISDTGVSGASNLAMQTDGNLVLYTPTNVPVWSSGTSGNPGSHLALSDTGVLSVVSPGGLTLWATPNGPTGYQMSQLTSGQQLIPNQSLVSANGAGTLALQPGGVVVAAKSGVVTMSPTTSACWLAATLVMQTDGNVVDYCGSAPLWFTGTGGNPGAMAQITNDGALKVLSASGAVLWPVVVPPTTLAQRIVAFANGQDQMPGGKAITETPAGSNCNPFTGYFGRGSAQGSVVVKGKTVAVTCAAGTRAEAWCSDFAQWVWTQAGAITTNLSGWSYSFVQYGQANNTFHPATPTYLPKVGDAVIFGTVVGPNGYGSHVGIVTGVNVALNEFQMTSGNWGDAVIQTPMMPLSAWLNSSQNGAYNNLLGYTDPVPASGSKKPALRAALAPTALSGAGTASSISQAMINSQDLGH